MGDDRAAACARPDDWSAVAGLLVELGRGVAAGTAEDPTHRMQFGGHLRRLDSVTLVAELDGAVIGVVDMDTTSGSAIIVLRRA